MDSLQAYLARNLVYPKEALVKRVEGSVIVVLTVNADSSLRVFDVFDIGYGTGQEAVRLLLSTAPWQPAINLETNEPASSTLLVPVNFKLEE